MTVHLYFSLIPEALIASMLPPDEFGTYYAVGTHKKLHGQAMFIELDPDFRHEFFKIDAGIERCVPHPNGMPKRSVYISTYRVLEHVPVEAMQKLYLVTSYGEVLGLDPSPTLPGKLDELNMYQEIAPVHPLVVSTLNPKQYYEFLTQNPNSLVHFPAVCFVDLQLGELAEDPEHGAIRDLPYGFIHHLRECLLEVRGKQIHSKIVNRVESVEYPYRMIKNGIYLGNGDNFVYYPLPSRDELRGKYYRWWRSANQG
ncbi:MAG: hypothetical protein H6652_06520 [Ardenticatenaceae bacterium]|nr:hypothetical protein [Ardenticatenaceae bacterium]MCB8946836.1 hypothetical protein [Ardenticatenaceae bacterium]